MTNALPYEVRTYATREEWLQDRRHGIGASDIGAMLGLSQFKTPLELYHEKRGEISRPPREGEWLEWGQALEEPIAQRFARETGRAVIRPSVAMAAAGTAMASDYVVLVDRERPYLRTSIDRFFRDAKGTTGTLEIKNVSEWRGKEWEATGTIPDEYLLQVQAGLGIVQMEGGSFACLIGGNRFRYDDIAHDPRLVDIIRERAAEFWRRVELGDPPPVTAEDKEVIKMLYPSDTGETVTLPADLITVDEELVGIKERIKALAAKKDELENTLKLAIGSASVGVLPNGNAYTFKTINKKPYSVGPVSYRDFRRKGVKPQATGAVLPAEML